MAEIEAKALVERLREENEWTNQRPYFHAHAKSLEAANLIETQAREIERLRGELSGISGKLKKGNTGELTNG